MTNDVARKCIYTHPECKKEYRIATSIMELLFDLKYIYRYCNVVEVCPKNYDRLKPK
jgi:hypothetical protein